MELINKNVVIGSLNVVKEIAQGDLHMLIAVKALIETINEIPAVDAVPVVRCKDCKHWARNDGMFKDFDEREWHHCPHLGIETDGYFACIEGKKNDRDK